MEWFLISVVLAAAAIISMTLASQTEAWARHRMQQRKRFIQEYPFPASLYERLHARHPTVNHAAYPKVCMGLRHFFVACLRGKLTDLSMPSRVVDDLWHEFILHTREYRDFCRHAFGQYLDHTPAPRTGPRGTPRSAASLRRMWRSACQAEQLDPAQPTRLPLLFGIDAQLAIVGGFHYLLDDHGEPSLADPLPSGAVVRSVHELGLLQDPAVRDPSQRWSYVMACGPGGDGSSTGTPRLIRDEASIDFEGLGDGGGDASGGGGDGGGGCGGGGD